MRECPHCGALVEDSDVVCRYCARNLDGTVGPETTYHYTGAAGDPGKQEPQWQQPGADSGWNGGQQPPNYNSYQQGPYAPPPPNDPYWQGGHGAPGPNPYGPRPGYPPYGGPQYGYPIYRNVNRIVAGVLGIVLGGLGVHKFYIGKVGMGFLYLFFCWTGIPAIAGLIEGILYLCQDDQTFREKYCRLN